MDARRRMTMPPTLNSDAVNNAHLQALALAKKPSRQPGNAYPLEARKQDKDTSEVWPDSPLSPTTTVVRRAQRTQPQVAVVHSISLRDGFDAAVQRTNSVPDISRDIPRPSSSGATKSAAEIMLESSQSRKLARRATLPVDMGSSVVRASSTSAIRETSQGKSAEAQDTNKIRMLEPWEIRERSQNAVDYFKNAKAINRKARTIEDTEYLLAEARRRRAEKELEESKPINVRTRSKESAPASTGPIAKEPVKTEEPAAPKPMTLAERMGYGVKTTQGPDVSKIDSFEVAAQAASASVRFKKGGAAHMVGVQAGNNTLLQRLGAKRRTIQ